MYDTIEITPTTRLRIEADICPENPRVSDDWWLTGYVNIPGRGDSHYIEVPDVFGDHLDIAYAHERFLDEDVTERWARIFRGAHIEYDAEHGGYWFVDGPSAFTLDKQAEIIESERKTYQQWCDGEVAVVVLEREIRYVRVDDIGTHGTITRWEEEDSLGGCYLDDDYTAEQVALEQFNLNEEERAALEARR